MSETAGEESFITVEPLRVTHVAFDGEGTGVKPLTKKLCDGVISIPMFGKVNSLNASVSAGIVLYEAVRQRI